MTDESLDDASMFEAQTGDEIWLPNTANLDKRLVTTMGSFLASCSQEQIHIGFEELVAPLRGINRNQSLIEDIKEKSGMVSSIFIREAVNCLYYCMIRGIVATEVPRLLLSPLARSDAPEDESYVQAELIRGCLWEVFASLVVLIVSEGAPDAPASSFDAMRRTRYIENKLYETSNN